MAEEKTSCVLRLFGAPQGQLAGAVGQFAPQWKTQAQWKSRGGETLLALQAASPSGLKKAAQSLQAQFEADLYGAGDTSLAAAVVNACWSAAMPPPEPCWKHVWKQCPGPKRSLTLGH